jgi:hypothetical protein
MSIGIATTFMRVEDSLSQQSDHNPDWEKAVDKLWTGENREVAYIARLTGRRPIEVRRAFMEVGPDTSRVIAVLRETSSQA